MKDLKMKELKVKKVISVVLCVVMIFAMAGCGKGESGSKSLEMDISDRDVDVEYMQSSDLSVFGIDDPEALSMESEMKLDFAKFEEGSDGNVTASGTGKLTLGEEAYDFEFADVTLSKVEVSEENTLYESVFKSTVEIAGKPLDITIDLVASEDFDEAVATVFGGGDGTLLFGEIFNDYLEYYNMILGQLQKTEKTE